MACIDPKPFSAVHGDESLPFPELSNQCLCTSPQAPTITFDNVFMFLSARSFFFLWNYLCYKYMLLPDTWHLDMKHLHTTKTVYMPIQNIQLNPKEP